MAEKKDDKPILVPDITPELLEKNEAEQKILRGQFGLPKNPAVLRNQALIDSNLEILKGLLAQYQKADGGEKDAVLLQINKYQDELAQTFASTGHFRAALKLSFDERRKTLYKSYIGAVERDENDWCEHSGWTRENGNIEQIAYREFDFFSPDKGQTLSMIRCNKCGFRNAVAKLPDDLAKLSEMRKEIVSATSGGEHKDAKTISRKLGRKDISEVLR